MKKKRYALISVFDKKKLKLICKKFNEFNIDIISTGSTANQIKKLGFNCELISDLTKFKEILDGRVKTLHPKIYASLLHNRKIKSHLKTFNQMNFPTIDFVIVNLYPFEKIIKTKKTAEKCIEMIDIGGSSLLRAAAKNFKFITVVSSIDDYEKFITNLEFNKGNTNLNFRKDMSYKAFTTTSAYDNAIATWFSSTEKNKLKLITKNRIKLKYGENPNQKSFYYNDQTNKSLFKYQIQGRDLGYNNILDISSGLDCLNEFTEPTCVIIKHNNPCGVASSNTIYNAYKKAFDSDPVSAFGGIVMLNRPVDKKLANIFCEKFFEIIVSKKFNKDALSILKKKQKLILIKNDKLSTNYKDEIKSVIGGYLTQEKNNTKIKKSDLHRVSNKKARLRIFNDLIFAFKICKHVKSNAIVLVNNKQTVGIGAGQMSRLDATKIAILKSKTNAKNILFVAASDAFFPFIDNIKLLIKNNCKGIVQPKGSINDKKIIEFANKNNLPLYFTNYRLFKH